MRDLRDKLNSRAVLDENRPASALDNTVERLPGVAHQGDLLCQVIGSKDNSTLGRVWAAYGSTQSNIEVLLTRFDLDLMTNNGRLMIKNDLFQKADRDAISREIAEFVNRFRFEKDVEWLHPFLDQTLSNKDVIISLNYDCFLEGFLDSREAWSPNGGVVLSKMQGMVWMIRL